MARTFNGANPDYLSTAALSWPTTAITVAGWLYITSIPANTYEGVWVANVGGAGIFAKISGLGWRGRPIYLPVTGTPGYVFYEDPDGTHFWSLNTWYHRAAVYDTTNGLKAYQNGTSYGTATANGNLAFGSVVMNIGQDPTTAGRGVYGNLADFAIWNVALSAAEILSLSQGIRPNAIRTLNLIGWWPIDGLASPEPDLSGAKHNATLNGTPTLGFGPPIAPFTPRWPQYPLPPAPPPAFVLMPQIVW
jgi:hypothetical protein